MVIDSPEARKSPTMASLPPSPIQEPSQSTPKQASRTYAQAAALTTVRNTLINSTQTQCGVMAALQVYFNSRKLISTLLSLSPIITHPRSPSCFTDPVVEEVVNIYRQLHSNTHETKYAPTVLTGLLFKDDPIQPRIQHDANEAFARIHARLTKLIETIHSTNSKAFPPFFTPQQVDSFINCAQVFLADLAHKKTQQLEYNIPNHTTAALTSTTQNAYGLINVFPQPALPSDMSKALKQALQPEITTIEGLRVTHNGATYTVQARKTECYDSKTLPGTLIFNINRISVASGTPVKDCSIINFSPTLQHGTRVYLLTQIILHWGVSHDRGHYTSLAKVDQRSKLCTKWTHYNDSTVTQLSFPDVQHLCKKHKDKTVSLFIYDLLAPPAPAR